MYEIISSELRPVNEKTAMTADEMVVLQNIRQKRIGYVVGTYCVFLCVLIYVLYYGWTHGRDEDDIRRYHLMTPILVGFGFTVLTVYFAYYYFKSVHPLTKDLKSRLKRIQYFIPSRYKAPFVAEHYLKTPLKKIPLIKVDQGFYDQIHPDSVACICFAAESKFVLSIEVDGQKISFNYSVAMGDV